MARSSEKRAAVLKRDDWTCVECGHRDRTGRTLEADHVVPLSGGGKDTVANMRTLCRWCHREATRPIRSSTMARTNASRKAWREKNGKRATEGHPGMLT